MIENELVNLSMVYGKKNNSHTLEGVSSELRDIYTFLKGVSVTVAFLLDYLQNVDVPQIAAQGESTDCSI